MPSFEAFSPDKDHSRFDRIRYLLDHPEEAIPGIDTPAEVEAPKAAPQPVSQAESLTKPVLKQKDRKLSSGAVNGADAMHKWEMEKEDAEDRRYQEIHSSDDKRWPLAA